MEKAVLFLSFLLLLVAIGGVVGEDNKRDDDLTKKFREALEAPWVRPPSQEKLKSSREKRTSCGQAFCDPLYPDQWHLNKTFLNITDPEVEGVDIGVDGAWSQGYHGKGVLISIIDDGVEVGHPDLSGYTRSVSFDFEDKGQNPSRGSDHGTSCAGVAVARKNDVCGVGVAYDASYGGVRLLGAGLTAADEAMALTYGYTKVDIYSSSWGPPDDGLTLFPLEQVVSDALELGVNLARGGKGAIYMWAAGNGAHNGDSCSYDGYVESRFTIPIGAVDEYGKKAFYSEECPALLAVTPSSGDTLGIATTDRQAPNGYEVDSDCTLEFSGTSAAAPMAAGVVALILEANPLLTWRDVQGVLITSSARTDKNDPGWEENGGGYFYNRKYGYGLINASRAVITAKLWPLMTDYTLWESPAALFNRYALPNTTEGFSFNFTVPENQTKGFTSDFGEYDSSRIEHAILTVDVQHPARNNLTITLTSPFGTVSTLSTPHLQGQVPTFTLIERDFDVTGAEMGFGGSLKRREEGPFYAFTGNSCQAINEDLTGKVVLVVMNQTVCSPYNQATFLQSAGAKAGVFAVDYVGEFKPFEGGPLVDISVMQIGASIGVIILEAAENVNGESSMVMSREYPQPDYRNYPFSSVRHWGETGVGNWTVKITDNSENGNQGYLNSLQLTLYGEGFVTKYHYERERFNTLQLVLGIIAIILAVIVAGIVTVSYISGCGPDPLPRRTTFTNSYEYDSESEDMKI